MASNIPRLERAITAHLSPMLRGDGFLGSGRRYRRVVSGFVQVVHVQSSRRGGEFAINLATQPLGVPDALGNPVEPQNISEQVCEFRRRLSEVGTDQWWAFDADQASMDTAMRAARDVFATTGRRLFSEISGPESPFLKVTPLEFSAGKFDFSGFSSTAVRMALVLARLRLNADRPRDALEFACFGLANLGRASALKSEFDEVCDRANSLLVQG